MATYAEMKLINLSTREFTANAKEVATFISERTCQIDRLQRLADIEVLAEGEAIHYAMHHQVDSEGDRELMDHYLENAEAEVVLSKAQLKSL